MAINPNTNPTMAGRITAPSAAYPYGSSKDESGAGVGDGTPYFKGRADDIFGMQQALLSLASIVPSGNADSVTASQYAQALVELASGRAQFYDETGVADAYVLAVKTDQYAPASLFDGLTVIFEPGNVNTGASTINVAGLGVKDIKLPDGSDPAAGEIDGLIKLRFNLASDRFELDLTGQIKVTKITVSGAYNPPAGVKWLRITAIGAGGGGGGVDGQGANTARHGGCGGGGATARSLITDIAASYTVTIGAAGTGGAAGNNNGTAGGDTTVVGTGLNLSAGGGGEGNGGTAVAGSGTSAGGAGGIATGGDDNLSGGDGMGGRIGGGDLSMLGLAGASILGGQVASTTNSAGTDAVVFGAGGAGATVDGTTTNYAGGDGVEGVVFIEEGY